MTELIEHEKSTYTQYRVAVAVSGMESFPAQEGGGRFTPQGIIIIYGQQNLSPWRLVSIELYGPKLKKGGDHSAVTGKHLWWPTDTIPPEIVDCMARHYPLNFV